MFCSCGNKLSEIQKNFGESHNPAREKLGLVPVDPHLQLEEDNSLEDRRYIFIHENEEGLKAADYLRKIIVLDTSSKKLSIEEDHFKNPGIDQHLIITHYYYADSTSIVLQSTRSAVLLNAQQADSVLISWNIGHNPFIKK